MSKDVAEKLKGKNVDVHHGIITAGLDEVNLTLGLKLKSDSGNDDDRHGLVTIINGASRCAVASTNYLYSRSIPHRKS